MKGEIGIKDTLYIRRKVEMKTHGYYIALITLKWKKYKTFHRTFSDYTNIKRHSNFILQDKKGMSSSTNATDKQTKLLKQYK